MLRISLFGLCLASLSVLVSGCTESGANGASSKYLLAKEPADAKNIATIAESAKNNDEVVAVGRIGGSETPFVEGQAAFTIVDLSLVPCNEKDDDSCQTPWDYCCDTDKLKTHSVAVQMVDDQGKPVKVGAKELLKVKELQTLVIKGKVERAGDTVTILANSLFVRPDAPKKK